MRVKRGLLAALALLAAALLAGCGGDGPGGRKETIERPAYQGGVAQLSAPAEGAPIAIFDTSLGEIRAQLFAQDAPLAVQNFTSLAQEGYYDGITFHRAVYGFVVQSGDAGGDGLGGRTIWGRPYPVEYSGRVRHYSGALCAAFSQDDPVSGGSQFYFVAALPGALDEGLRAQMEGAGWPEDALEAYAQVGGLPYLDNTDTVFGQVYQGMEVVDAIARAETDENGRPLEEITLNSVTIASYSAAEAAPSGGSDADAPASSTPEG